MQHGLSCDICDKKDTLSCDFNRTEVCLLFTENGKNLVQLYTELANAVLDGKSNIKHMLVIK